MNVLDLFSGIGGFSLGLERAGMRTVAFCEIDDFCQKVLASNFDSIPIFQNIATMLDSFDKVVKDEIDIVCGGIPCQPFSTAGKKRGTKDNRDLWPHMFRVVKRLRPTWVIVENVANFANMAFTRTKTDLEGEGYKVQPFIIPACAVAAAHERKRIWIIAHLDCEGCSGKATTTKKKTSRRGPAASINIEDWSSDISSMGRAIYDVSNGVDGHREQRVKALGNSIIPAIAEIIGLCIMEISND